MSPPDRLAAAGAAVAEAAAAPLSAKKALLAALLIDAAADARFAQGGDGDILAFRDALAEKSAPLALVFAIAARRLDLVTEAVEVPVADYPKLAVEDFMVSLYNGHTVQRVRVVLPDGSHADVHEVLEQALAALAT